MGTEHADVWMEIVQPGMVPNSSRLELLTIRDEESQHQPTVDSFRVRWLLRNLIIFLEKAGDCGSNGLFL